MSKAKVPNEFGFAPLRSLDDFLLESARFQIPNVKDLEKWNYRVTSNLLYYQTNYFLTALIIFTIVGVIHPLQVAVGFIVTAVIFMAFCYITNERAAASQFKRKHPIISVLVILTGCYFVTYMLGSLLIFLLGVFLPISAEILCVPMHFMVPLKIANLIFIHASLRLRNLKNKITIRVETFGLKRTPMGIFLEELGMEQEGF